MLDSFPTIKIAVAYHVTSEDGTVTVWRDRLPADLRQLDRERCKVEYVELDGWNSEITGCRSWEQLPQKAKEYVEFVEKEVGVPIEWVGVGPARDAMVTRS